MRPIAQLQDVPLGEMVHFREECRHYSIVGFLTQYNPVFVSSSTSQKGQRLPSGLSHFEVLARPMSEDCCNVQVGDLIYVRKPDSSVCGYYIGLAATRQADVGIPSYMISQLDELILSMVDPASARGIRDYFRIMDAVGLPFDTFTVSQQDVQDIAVVRAADPIRPGLKALIERAA